jgi:hypothetical protein
VRLRQYFVELLRKRRFSFSMLRCHTSESHMPKLKLLVISTDSESSLSVTFASGSSITAWANNV